MDYNPELLTKAIQYVLLSKRHKLGLTQLGLSRPTQLTRQFISQVESGKRQPSISTMSTLASACDTCLSEIFTEIDKHYLRYVELESSIVAAQQNKAADSRNGIPYIQNTSSIKPAK